MNIAKPIKTLALAAVLLLAASGVLAQSAGSVPPPQTPSPAPPPTAAAAGTASPIPEKVALPTDYIIGVNDVLSIVFWREKDMSADVVVRPDGRISLPLVNEVVAIGLTPEELRMRITAMAEKYVQEPAVSVVVKQINSRVVYITGLINKPGPYPLMASTTVMQLIAMAGGLAEWAKGENIVIMRTVNGKQLRYKFNYKWMLEGLNMRQNIELQPGDTVLVP